ncbi:MAG: hypothetical protein QOF11_1436 [Chloroflexota bacterium]|nr:hypothetical protein [Chloroflexota bacterium]
MGRRSARGGARVPARPVVTPSDARETLTVNVASLLAEPGGSVRDYAFDDLQLDLGEDLALARPADARFRLTRTNRGLLVDGDVRATLAETCSRCLRPIEVGVAEDIDEEALPSVDLATGAPLDRSEEPEVARLTGHHEVELEPLVREAIQLAEPIAPLCRPDCPGLCPECGEELGSGPHDHGEAPIDPRLEALRAFRVDAGDETA